MYEATGVSVHLGGRLIVSDIDLAVAPGRVVALIGPNGAGKSTLLHALAGERRPTRGTVRINGEDVAGFSPRALAGWRAVLGQSVALSAPFTVAEVVRLGVPETTREHNARTLVSRGLDAVDLALMAERPITRLSGGEQQRAHAARVLVQLWAQPEDGQARYLFLDEPTAHLDPAHQRAIMSLARDHARAGGGVLAVLHDLNLAAAVADEIVVLSNGRIAGRGTPADVLTPSLLKEVYGVSFDVELMSGILRVMPDYGTG